MIKDDIYVALFNNNNCEVLATTKLISIYHLPAWYDWNLENNEKCQKLKLNDIYISIIPSREYERLELCDKLKIKTKVIIKKIWSVEKYKRDFSYEQVYQMYHNDQINFNLKNIILNGFVDVKFIPIKELEIRPEAITCGWKSFMDNPYLTQWNNDKLKLGESIRDIGTWFPFIVDTYSSDNGKLYVYEGNHRIIALKLLAASGGIDENYKVMCLIPKFNQPHKSHKLSNELKIKTLKYRYILENVYSSEVLNNDKLHEEVVNLIKQKNEVFVNPYTVETTAVTVSELYEAIVDQPYILKYLIHEQNDSILPSKIINDEKEYKRWIQKEQ